jgi:adenine-specific DNA-methyltransferase
VDTISQAHINKFGLDQGELGSGVFVLTKEEVESLNLDEHESEIIKPWFKNSDVSRYFVNKEPETFLIFADKRTNSLDSRPKLMDHLNSYRALIDKASSNSPYLARPRSTDYDSPKIVVPYKTPTTRFAIAYGPWYASRDIYYIVSKSGQISLETAVGILNSKLMLCWLAHRGKRKGGLLELYQEPLSAIPLPRWILEESELLKSIQALVLKAQAAREQQRNADVGSIEREIDEAVFKLYRLEPEFVKIIQDWDFVEEQV